MTMRKRLGNAAFVEMTLITSLVLLILLSFCIGTYPLEPAKVFRIVWAVATYSDGPNPAWTDTDKAVVEVIRLPRILLAALAGAGLSLCGACLQGLMRNPLVGPDLVGVSAGASFGGVIAIELDLPQTAVIAAAFFGGFVAVLIALGLARLAGKGMLVLVLSGIVVGAFFSAGVSFCLYLAEPIGRLECIIFWMLGSFASANREKH
jgi:iron complex transport system permease protein